MFGIRPVGDPGDGFAHRGHDVCYADVPVCVAFEYEGRGDSFRNDPETDVKVMLKNMVAVLTSAMTGCAKPSSLDRPRLYSISSPRAIPPTMVNRLASRLDLLLRQ